MEYEASIDGLQVGKEHFTPKKLKEIIAEIDRRSRYTRWYGCCA